MKNILVAGGAGYIGSHTVLELVAQGYNPIIVDNLSTGHKKSIIGGIFYECDISDRDALKEVFKKHPIDTVMHFSANCYVGESVVNPHKYFKNNVGSTINLLDVMLEFDVKKFIFSSTASTYGHPNKLPMDELHAQVPCNPYGLSKLFVEQIVSSYEKAYGLKHIFLRYFNAAGSDLEGRIGEDHYPETHIIPLLMQTALGLKKQFTIFGTDYDTEDGTCIRDYIHVQDIAEVHVRAVQYLDAKNKSNIFNLGSSIGYSVKEIVDKVAEITSKKINIEESKRRAGDPAVLIASSEKAKRVLEWEPKYDLNIMISSAWKWFNLNPQGYQDGK